VASAEQALALIWKGFKAFLLFWKDFLVGDAPELALGVAIILAIAILLHHSAVLAGVLVILLVVALASLTVWRKAR
jgi:hypothetical protein